MGLIFFIFILVPVIEIYFLIQIGGEIGAFTTILLIILTAVTGASIIKYQGIRVWGQMQKEIQQGRTPTTTVWHTLLLAVAGVLLLTPGFVTDTIGALLLVPAFRLWLLATLIRRWLQSRLRKRVDVIEGEFKVIDK